MPAPPEVNPDKFLIGPDDPLVVETPAGEVVEYHRPTRGMVTVTDQAGKQHVMTIERYNELEAMEYR